MAWFPRGRSVLLAQRNKEVLPKLFQLVLIGVPFETDQPVSFAHLPSLRFVAISTSNLSVMSGRRQLESGSPGIAVVALQAPFSTTFSDLVETFDTASTLALLDTSSTPNFPLLLKRASPNIKRLFLVSKPHSELDDGPHP